MDQDKGCPVCGRVSFMEDETYCSFQCSFIASTTRGKFYGRKDLR
ncbi:MAG: hypothetical protein OER82_04150 [Nitrosopumilus sp.]|nr:hypothetical protein [Nitrosopumilus sp.]